MIDDEPIEIFIIFIITVFLICIYGKYRCSHPEYKDILMTKFNFLDLDGWSATHFILFFILGYIYPTKIWLCISLGILWELFEQLYGKKRPGFLGGFGDCITTDPNVKNGAWWYGKLSDIVVNYVGFIIGSYVKTNKIIFY